MCIFYDSRSVLAFLIFANFHSQTFLYNTQIFYLDSQTPHSTELLNYKSLTCSYEHSTFYQHSSANKSTHSCPCNITKHSNSNLVQLTLDLWTMHHSRVLQHIITRYHNGFQVFMWAWKLACAYLFWSSRSSCIYLGVFIHALWRLYSLWFPYWDETMRRRGWVLISLILL